MPANRSTGRRPAAFFSILAAVAGLATGLTAGPAASQTAFKLTTVVDRLENPWGLAFLPDGDFLVTERPGRMLRIDGATGEKSPISGVPTVGVSGQGGLLDVALDPGFAENGLIYFSYAGPGDGGLGTEVARATLDGDRLSDLQVIFKAQPKVGGGRHFGSRLAFAPDGSLFVSLGERGQRDQAQDPSNHLGGMIRIHPDGTVPDDNPFAGTRAARPEVFNYGHRNVQGLAVHPETGQVWSHEHGPRGGDEINIERPGANYGWPKVTFGINYSGTRITDQTSAPGIEDPIHQWTPSIAPSGMAFYWADAFPEWKGSLFVGSLKFRELHRLSLDGNKIADEEIVIDDYDQRIRDVRVGPDGLIYLLTDDSRGRLVRLEPERG